MSPSTHPTCLKVRPQHPLQHAGGARSLEASPLHAWRCQKSPKALLPSMPGGARSPPKTPLHAQRCRQVPKHPLLGVGIPRDEGSSVGP